MHLPCCRSCSYETSVKEILMHQEYRLTILVHDFLFCVTQSSQSEVLHWPNLPHRPLTPLVLDFSQLCHSVSWPLFQVHADKLWEKSWEKRHQMLRDEQPSVTISWPCWTFKNTKPTLDFLCTLIIFLCYVFSDVESQICSPYVKIDTRAFI